MDQALTLWLNGSQSLYWDSVMQMATRTSTWIPLLLVLAYIIFREHDLPHFLFLIFAGLCVVLVCDQVASSIFKPLVERWRPAQDPYLMHQVDVVCGYRGGWYGFFSSHAANTAGVALFFSLVFRRRSVMASLLAWSLLSSWSRIYLGVHYVGDVLVGWIFGAAVAYGAYRLYCRRFSDARTWNYASQHLLWIPLTFLLTLNLMAIPWKLYF